MNLLLDTHAFLWFITGDNKLPEKIVNLINDFDNKCYVSIACIWEIVIKLSLDKIEIKDGFNTIEDFLKNNDFEILPINLAHTKKLLKLEYYYKDPFDRMIISQAIVEKLVVITRDSFFKEYKVKVMW
jgi:PIN domain nuclease of toxin-antitoxin system